MESHSSTLPVDFVHQLLQGLEISAEDRLELFQQVGIPEFLLNARYGRVTVSQFALLYRMLATLFDDETPGFFSRPFRGGVLKYLCLSLIDAPSLAVALHRFCQYFRLILDDAYYQILIENEQLIVRFIEVRKPRGNRVLVHELMLKLVHGVASWLIGKTLPPIKTCWAYSAPPHSREYLYLYPGDVLFDQPHSAFHFSAKYLQLPIRSVRSELSSFLNKAPAEWIHVSFGEQLLAHRIKDYLHQAQATGASIAHVAETFHLSVRTLSRRLVEEGTTFQSIKDGVRRDIAIQQLSDKRISLTELANRLGFEDLTSFNRAFKKWTGSTPGAYRRP